MHDRRCLHPLMQDHNMVRRLKDLKVLVVASRNDRRTRVKPKEATLRKAPVFITIRPNTGGTNTNRTRTRDIFSKRQLNHFKSRLQGGNTAVWRISNQRRPILIDNITSTVKPEIVIATNPTVEGETTALYISKKLSDSDVKVTRLARGIPVGGDLEYTDEATLIRAMEGRTLF